MATLVLRIPQDPQSSLSSSSRQHDVAGVPAYASTPPQEYSPAPEDFPALCESGGPLTQGIWARPERSGAVSPVTPSPPAVYLVLPSPTPSDSAVDDLNGGLAAMDVSDSPSPCLNAQSSAFIPAASLSAPYQPQQCVPDLVVGTVEELAASLVHVSRDELITQLHYWHSCAGYWQQCFYSGGSATGHFY